MHPILYAILGVVIILILGPAVFADRSPIPETSVKVHKITKPSELNALMASTAYVVVDFYADWCPPCRTIAPVFSKLADEHAVPGQLGFAKVNVDHIKDVAQLYGISAMPTFLVLRNGKPTEVAVRKRGMTEDEPVGKVLGADAMLLRSVVKAVAEKVKTS